MIDWVYGAARACPQLDEVLIATDSERVADLCTVNTAGPPAHLARAPSRHRPPSRRSPSPARTYTSTSRATNPSSKPSTSTALLRPFERPQRRGNHPQSPCTPENINNPNAVKVVTAPDGRALYFSRATIPYDRDGSDNPPPYWKHIGLYAYRKSALDLFPTLPHQHPRNHREPRTTPLPRKRHQHPRSPHRLRHHRSRHRRRPPRRRSDPALSATNPVTKIFCQLKANCANCRSDDHARSKYPTSNDIFATGCQNVPNYLHEKTRSKSLF